MPRKSKINKKNENESNNSDDDSEERTVPDEATMDVLQQSIGNFGRWQCQVFLIMCLIAIPNSWTEMSIQLLGHRTEFWCKPPNRYEHMTTEEWKNLIATNDTEKSKKTTVAVGSCMMVDVMNPNATTFISCLWGFDYNTSIIRSNIITEWDLVCDREYLVYVLQILTMLGLIFGGVIFGIASDKYGRRKSLLFAIVFRSICGVCSSAARNYYLFLFLRFTLAFFDRGVSTIGMIICLETVAGKWRSIIPILYQIPYGLGLILMSSTTYFLLDWRISQFALFISSTLCIVCYRLIPESPKWLLSVGKDSDAVEILEHAGKVNGLDDLMVRTVVEYFSDSSNESKTYSCLILLKNPKLRNRTIMACINGLLVFIVARGLAQYMGLFSDNVFFSINLQGVLTICASLLGVLTIFKFNRKLIILIATTLSGIFILLLLGATSRPSLLKSVIIAIGYLCCTVVVTTIQPLICELFPTGVRNSGYGIVSIFISIGAFLSPFVVFSGEIVWFMPLVILATIALIEAIFALLLPENAKVLPQTMEDIELSNFA